MSSQDSLLGVVHALPSAQLGCGVEELQLRGWDLYLAQLL